MSEFVDRLADQVKRAGYDGAGGTTRLHRLMAAQHGLTVTLSAVSYWLRGDRTPEPKHLRVLLDALDVRGAERDALVDLAYPGLLVTPADAPNRLEEDDIPTEPGRYLDEQSPAEP